MKRMMFMPPILAGSALLVTLCGCSNDEAPVPADALEQVVDQAVQENAQQASAPSQGMPRTPTQLPEDATTEPAPAPSGVTPADGETVTVGNVSMAAPSSWTSETTTSSMRAAQFSAGETGSFVVFQGIGGGAEANIQRWIGQVGAQESEPRRDRIQRDGLVIHTIEMTGTYQGMTMSGGAADPSAGTTFFGAIVEGGSVPIQVRLTVSSSETESARDDWNAFIASIARG